MRFDDVALRRLHDNESLSRESELVSLAGAATDKRASLGRTP